MKPLECPLGSGEVGGSVDTVASTEKANAVTADLCRYWPVKNSLPSAAVKDTLVFCQPVHSGEGLRIELSIELNIELNNRIET